MRSAIRKFICHLQDLSYSPLTCERYDGILRDLVAFLRQELEEDVQPVRVSKDLLAAFLRQGRNDSPASAVTRNTRLGALRTFFAYLQREEVIKISPASKLDFAKTAKKQAVFLTFEEYLQLLVIVEEDGSIFQRLRNYAIVVTFFNTGMRLAELVSLNVDQIDWVNLEFRSVPLKGKKVGSVDFNGEVASALRLWLSRRSSKVPEGEDALFISEQRRRISRRAVQDMFTKYSKRLGIGKNITPHVMRHSTATGLLQRNVDVRVVQQVLHHNDLNTTAMYTHLADQVTKEAVARLSEPPGEYVVRRVSSVGFALDSNPDSALKME